MRWVFPPAGAIQAKLLLAHIRKMASKALAGKPITGLFIESPTVVALTAQLLVVGKERPERLRQFKRRP